MRIAEFTLERYGRFQDHRLTMPKRDQDFHLVYGPNEAGKTTTLCALADLLFGFEHRVAHAYRFPAPALRVGAVLESGGERLSCRRRRGRSGTLVNAEDAPIDEGQLSAMLHGMSRDAFLQSSSLDHARLRDGGRAMAESRDDVGQMLFAAGSGLTNLKQVLASLDDELDALWGLRRSERRTFTRAESLWKDARSQLKETSVKPAEWNRAKTEVTQATKTFLEADAARRQSAAALASVERLRRIFPLLGRRRNLSDDLASRALLHVPEATEAAARSALEVAAQQQQKRDAAQALLEAVQATLQSEPDQLPIIAVGDRLDALVQDLSAELQRRQERPALEADLAGAQSSAQTLAATLDLQPDQALTVALPPAGVIQQLRDHAKRRVELATRVNAADEAATTAREEFKAASQALAEAAEPSALTELEAAAQAAQRAGDIDEQIEKQTTLAERERDTLTRSLQTLQSWSGEVSALFGLAPLPDEAVDEAADKFNVLNRSMEDAQRTAADRAEALDLARAKAETLAGAEGVVSLEMLREARDTRDQSISRIGEHLGGALPLPSPREEVEGLKRSVTTADQLADRRFAAADAAAQLAVAQAEVGQAETRHRHAQHQIAQALLAVEELSADWAARLKAQQLPNLAPMELRAWLRRRMLCLTAKQAVDDAEAELLRLSTRRQRLHQELATALGREVGDASRPLEPVLAEATARLEGLKRATSAFEGLKAEAKGAHGRQEEALRTFKSAERQLEEWQSQWEGITAEVALNLQPMTADIRLSAFEQLGRAREQAKEFGDRLKRSEAQSKAFTDHAREIVAALSLPSDQDPLESIRQAKALLETARSKSARRQALQEQADKHDNENAAANAALLAAENALSDALTLTGAANRLELADALDQARERRLLEEQLRTLNRELDEQADGVSLAELEQACASLSFDELVTSAGERQREAEEATTQAQDARSIMAESAQRFKQFEAQEDATGWASELELARAEMESLADAYVMKKTQRILLGHAMKRQGERARHPLLTRAAELFRTLTLQRHTDLVVDRDADKPRLLSVCDDGSTMVQIDDMSEGTQDQLFLALRLAAVEQSMTNGARAPFLADDLFVTFDDERACSGLQVLGELSRTTQVLFFTHHAHLRELAESLFPDLMVHDLQVASG